MRSRSGRYGHSRLRPGRHEKVTVEPGRPSASRGSAHAPESPLGSIIDGHEQTGGGFGGAGRSRARPQLTLAERPQIFGGARSTSLRKTRAQSSVWGPESGARPANSGAVLYAVFRAGLAGCSTRTFPPPAPSHQVSRGHNRSRRSSCGPTQAIPPLGGWRRPLSGFHGWHHRCRAASSSATFIASSARRLSVVPAGILMGQPPRGMFAQSACGGIARSGGDGAPESYSTPATRSPVSAPPSAGPETSRTRATAPPTALGSLHLRPWRG